MFAKNYSPFVSACASQCVDSDCNVPDLVDSIHVYHVLLFGGMLLMQRPITAKLTWAMNVCFIRGSALVYFKTIVARYEFLLHGLCTRFSIKRGIACSEAGGEPLSFSRRLDTRAILRTNQSRNESWPCPTSRFIVNLCWFCLHKTKILAVPSVMQ